jgi:UDPglucose 6-dehydrogenase
MKIAIIGTGYVGLVTGTCLAGLGNDVICVDVDSDKIKNLIMGKLPIYEPGLEDLVFKNVKEDRLHFTTDIKYSIEISDVVFITVGTPWFGNGNPDMTYVNTAAYDIGTYMNKYTVIVDKSTVPVGTSDVIKQIIKKTQSHNYDFDIISNPEFLREGEAIKDFMNPDRIVIGYETEKSRKIMEKIYSGIERTGKPIMYTDIKSAEIIKYASNAMLATRISFMNMLAPLCEKVNANIKEVSKGLGLDSRIGPRFLQAGVGYGGSCFPKDVKALIKTLEEYNCNADLLNAVENINELQKKYIIPKIESVVGKLKGKNIAIWGLAFKPKTDDMREAPSIIIIEELQKMGANIKAFDPVAKKNATKILKNIEYGNTPYDTIKNCDALVIITEWDEFRQLDLELIKSLLKTPTIIDGRNIYDPNEMESLGFKYISIGR